LELRYITDSQLSAALKYQELHRDRRIGEVLIETGCINEKQMLKVLSEKMNLTWAEVEETALDIRAAELISRKTAVKYQILPVCMKNDTLTVLVNDPLNFFGLEEVRQAAGCHLEVVLAEKEPLKRAINDCYAEIEAKQAASRANLSTLETVVSSDREAPVISLLDSLISVR
jgi:type IV pilus assembly protein PilB